MDKNVYTDSSSKSYDDYSPDELPEFLDENQEHAPNMQSVGQILQNPDQTQLFQQNSLDPSRHAVDTSTISKKGSNFTYRSAIKYGFIAAITMGAVLIVAMF
ncbi:hypothetical protein KDA00_02405 [Candidatus Saccharibacteria bacterium]|nr:hypothetical protein [Candidatus Saccharibacteria bacterium]